MLSSHKYQERTCAKGKPVHTRLTANLPMIVIYVTTHAELKLSITIYTEGPKCMGLFDEIIKNRRKVQNKFLS